MSYLDTFTNTNSMVTLLDWTISAAPLGILGCYFVVIMSRGDLKLEFIRQMERKRGIINKKKIDPIETSYISKVVDQNKLFLIPEIYQVDNEEFASIVGLG